jgi:hypothetical protein
MLIQKTPTVGDVVAIKLVNNDELVARITEADPMTITIEKAVLLAIAMDPNTQRPGINLLPFWMMGGEPDAKLTFQRNHVLALTPANKDMKSSWQQMTTSLQIPGSNGFQI